MTDREYPPSILVVDDTPANLLALSAVLAPLGVRIVEATSGEEALEHVRREAFSVALLDVQMPGMDGFETAERMREIEAGRSLPVIFLTAIHRDEDFVRRGYAIGAADYITKPFDPAVVRARVRAFVSLHEERERVRRAQVAVRTRERDDAVRRLVAFERIATIALETADLPDLLNELLSVFMLAAPDADTASILLREGDELRVHARAGLGHHERGDVPIGPESFAGAVAATRGPLEIKDAARSPIVQNTWLRERGTTHLYGAPLLDDGEVLGVAYLSSVRPAPLTETDKGLFSAMVERAARAVAVHIRRARVHDVLTSAPALIAILDHDDAHEFANPAYATFFRRHDLVGEPLSELDLDTSVGEVVARARATKGAVSVEELRVTEGRVLRLTAQPLRDYGSSNGSVVVFGVDVTAQVAAREERVRLLELERTARVHAETTSRMKDEFLANASHELRTPLNAILGWSVMARANAPPEVDRALAIVERNARAQARLIDDVLDVARIARGKLRLDTRAVRLRDLVEAALDAVRPAARAREISLHVSTPDEIIVEADPHRLQQVIWNLLSNAIKFTPSGGHVRVEGSAASRTATLEVSDTGEGIEPEFLRHLFEPFRQADGTTTRRHGGLGLGLSIVKQIIDAHGGSIVAESDGRGRGATFTLQIPRPLTRGPVADPSRDGPLPDRHDLEGLKVLIVDDDDDSRAVLSHMLAQRGAATATAESASRAFAELERFQPDVLVSDIAMPGGDGYELLRAVRALPEERGGRTPAIAVTALARASDGEQALDVGYQGHLAKPVDPSELVSLVAALGGRAPG